MPEDALNSADSTLEKHKRQREQNYEYLSGQASSLCAIYFSAIIW